MYPLINNGGWCLTQIVLMIVDPLLAVTVGLKDDTVNKVRGEEGVDIVNRR